MKNLRAKEDRTARRSLGLGRTAGVKRRGTNSQSEEAEDSPNWQAGTFAQKLKNCPSERVGCPRKSIKKW